MKPRCEICDGRGVIRLPRRPPMSVAVTERHVAAVAPMSDTWRTYPCPECSEMIPLDRLAVVEIRTLIDSRVRDPEYLQHVKNDAAARIGLEVHKEGFTRFFKGPENEHDLNYPTVMTLGVVAPNLVADLDERIAKGQDAFGQELIERAAQLINNWGSAAGAQHIHKERAIAAVSEALKYMKNKRLALKRA